jgi:ribosomal protein L40E
MICSRCQQQNPPQAKFCLECATPLARQCANCGTPLPVSAKFCLECAHPVGTSRTEPRQAEAPARFGTPESYEKVVSCLLAHFHGYDRLVLLSANFRLNEGGLRSLLRSIAAPVLTERHRQRFSLTVLFKGRKIDIAQYAERVTRVFEHGHFGFGYVERML